MDRKPFHETRPPSHGIRTLFGTRNPRFHPPPHTHISSTKQNTQALAARVTPRFALLALEAYGALLRSKYARENATAQQPAVELVESECCFCCVWCVCQTGVRLSLPWYMNL